MSTVRVCVLLRRRCSLSTLTMISGAALLNPAWEVVMASRSATPRKEGVLRSLS
jgi:hypothetical protein